jgi:hypothetical protein
MGMWFDIVLVVVAVAVGITVAVTQLRRAPRRDGVDRAVAFRRGRDESRREHITALYAAAADSDEEARRHLSPRNVNLQNPEGDSALHLAYRESDADAIARLVALGADATLRNHEGFTPGRMAELGAAEDLLERAMRCMSGCEWHDRERGRVLYEELRQCPIQLYNSALVRTFVRARPINHRRLVCLAVKVGHPGSEERLVAILDGYGTRDIAADYLNAGSQPLADGARRWAAAHGYVIRLSGSGRTAQWGSF